MNRTDRLQAIITHLQSKKQVTASEIAKRFGISIRTVYRDIKALEEAGIPIGAEAGIGYFLDENYHLPPVMFTNEEAGSLLLAGKFLGQQADPKLNQHFNDALFKIKSVLKASGKDFLENIEQRISVFQPVFDQMRADTLFITQLQLAISEKRKTTLFYQSAYRNEKTARMVQPIGLIHYAMTWHLIAYCELRNDYRDFRLDRILSLELSNDHYDINLLNSLETYFDNLILPDDAIDIVLEFPSEAFNAIGSRIYYMGYVKHTRKEDKVTAHFINTDYNYVARWLLTFGKSVKIISPPELENITRKMVEELTAHYA